MYNLKLRFHLYLLQEVTDNVLRLLRRYLDDDWQLLNHQLLTRIAQAPHALLPRKGQRFVLPDLFNLLAGLLSWDSLCDFARDCLDIAVAVIN